MHVKGVLLLTAIAACLTFWGLWQLTGTRPLGEEVELDCADCGPDRRAFIYAGHTEDPRDLVIVLHGFKGTAEGLVAATRGRFDELARSGAIVVAHAESDQASKNWYFGDAGSAPRQDADGQPVVIDDHAYMAALWDMARERHATLERIHLVGFSRGAMAAYAFACAQTLPIVSLTAVTMPLPEQAQIDCANVSGLDYTLVNGTRDQLVNYRGGSIELPWFASAGDRKVAARC